MKPLACRCSALVIVLLVISYTSATQRSGCLSADDLSLPFVEKNETIILGLNAWRGSKVNNAIAKIVLQEVLGYNVVEKQIINKTNLWVDIEENVVDAVLEVRNRILYILTTRILRTIPQIWPLLQAQNSTFKVKPAMSDLGRLGLTVQSGW